MNQTCKPQCETFPARCRTWCEACKYTQQHSTPKTTLYPSSVQCSSNTSAGNKTYFYVASDNTHKKKMAQSTSRPSSAGSTKSSNSSKKSSGVSSDSKITKKEKHSKKKISPLKNAEEHKEKKIDPASVQQLKTDMNAIKEQLIFLTQNRYETIGVTNELQTRYENLVKQSKEQQQEIEDLKEKNNILIEKINDQQILEGKSLSDAIATKKCLDQYESTLTTLYDEFLDSTKVMEEHICRCSKRKSKREVDSSGDVDSKYEKLMRSYQKAKEAERKYAEQNQQLSQTIAELENQLNHSTAELELFRNEAVAVAQRQQEELKEKKKSYAHQLETKAKEISELSTAIERLKNHVCSCSGTQSQDLTSQYDQLMAKYHEAMQKLKVYEETNIQRFKEIQLLRKKEKELSAQLSKLQEYTQNLTCATNGNSMTIAQLNISHQEKCNVIQCQKNEIASKDKQIEILLKNEEKLKNRIIQLQEELVAANLAAKSSKHEKSVVLTTEECSIQLTEELQDLITALYEEIDKTLAKDEQIKKQNRNICCLQCALSSKEKELSCVRNELKILREQFTSTLKEKQALTDHLKKLKKQNATYQEEEFSKECYCEM